MHGQRTNTTRPERVGVSRSATKAVVCSAVLAGAAYGRHVCMRHPVMFVLLRAPDAPEPLPGPCIFMLVLEPAISME